MTLVLEIEHLLGVSFAAREPGNDAPDWPPQPDRVFSALVASWGARGECDGERAALEWLERQPAPEIVASSGRPRTAATVFVPPGDFAVPADALNSRWFQFLERGIRPPKAGGYEKAWKDTLGVVPSYRMRAARRFSAFRPEDPVVSLVWPAAEPDADTLAALNKLAADSAYVGHSTSLTRCRFRLGEAPPGMPARLGIYPGRLAELERDFHADPQRRPRPGAPGRAEGAARAAAPASLFSDGWLVLEHVDGEMPDIRAAALVAKALRDAVMSGYRQIGRADAIPEAVSGHAQDGSPSGEPHLAIAPLAFIGWPHASGAVLGFALIPPRAGDLLQDTGFRDAVRKILKDRDGRRILSIRLPMGEVELAIGGAGGQRSLDPARYTGTEKRWASATPIVLDRHLKARGNEARDEEIRRLVAQACRNIGLPEPCRVAAGKHSAVEGAPSAYPSGLAPRWLRWRLPETLSSRQLVHAVIEFNGPVRGPVILGAGRFVGLGLCLPLAAERRP